MYILFQAIFVALAIVQLSSAEGIYDIDTCLKVEFR